MRILWLPLLASCTGSDPNRAEAIAYAKSLAPLLDENALIADRLLDVASSIHDDPPPSAEVRTAWSQDLVPMAEHLRDQSLFVSAPPSWSAPHKELAAVWSARADAWRDIAEAMDVGDLDLWRQGREKADTAKLGEEAWFQKSNEKMGAYGVVLDQFP